MNVAESFRYVPFIVHTEKCKAILTTELIGISTDVITSFPSILSSVRGTFLDRSPKRFFVVFT